MTTLVLRSMEILQASTFQARKLVFTDRHDSPLRRAAHHTLSFLNTRATDLDDTHRAQIVPLTVNLVLPRTLSHACNGGYSFAKMKQIPWLVYHK